MKQKNLLELFNETKELNNKHLCKDAFGNKIKIFGYVPSDENTGLGFTAINNENVFISRFKSLPIFGNLKLLKQDEKLPLKQTYVTYLADNQSYYGYINGKNINSLNVESMKNVSVEDKAIIYNAKEGDLFFWKDQDCILKKYGISKSFMVVGYYMYQGDYKYILTNPSELFLIENETEQY